MPELFNYVVRYDDGSAPNPYWGTCTLVICKPAIRRKAKVGDWIVGLGSKANPTKVDYGGKIVYVMKVTRKMTMRDYDKYTNERLHNKIPVMPAPGAKLRRDSREWRLRLGDSIYDFSREGITKRPGVHKQENRITDMNGKYVLLSTEFVYFGDQAIDLPKSLRGILHKNQGHRSRLNADHVHAFLSWWKTNRRKFAGKRVRGVPQWDVFANRKNLGACADAHMREDREDIRFGCT
jgi:hypothetical protein